jgi:predicted transcriptional regulator
MKNTVIGRLRTLLIVSSVLSSAATFAVGFSGIQQIDSLRIRDTGTVAVEGASGAWRDPDACGDSSVVVLSPQHEFYKETYATILMAHAAVREVRFRLRGCIEIYGTLYPEIQQAQVY